MNIVDKIVDIDNLCILNACHSKNKLFTLFQEKEKISVKEFISLDTLPKEDKIWVLMHEQYIGKILLQELALDFLNHIKNKLKIENKENISSLSFLKQAQKAYNMNHYLACAILIVDMKMIGENEAEYQYNRLIEEIEKLDGNS